MKSHIVLITPNFPPTSCGLGDYTFNMAKELIRNGLSVTIMTQKSAGTKRYLENARIVEVSEGWGIQSLIELKNALSKLNPDIVHLQFESFGYRQSYLLPVILKKYSDRLVITAHEVWFGSNLRRRRDLRMYKNCSAIVTNCNEARQTLTPLLMPSQRPTFFNIGVGSNIPSTILHVPRRVQFSNVNPLRIGYFGLFNALKKLDPVVRVVHALSKNHGIDVRLNMIGDYKSQSNTLLQETTKLIRNLDVEDRITWTGRLEPADAAQLLRECDLAILPFADGASPRRGTFQACAALGLPIVTTQCAYLEPEIIHGQTALLLKSIEFEALKDSVLQLASDFDLRQVLSLGARAYAENFTWTKIVQKHLKIYSKVSRVS